MNKERAQMQRIIAQGMHKTKIARELAHLPTNLNSEAVQKSRKESLEAVEKRTRRIRKALSDVARQRNDLQGCIQKLQAVKEAQNKAELERFVASRSSFFFGLKKMLSVEKVNNFNEGELAPRAQVTRRMSRALGMSIPDAEVFSAHFDKFNPDGNGVSRADFQKFFESLNGRDYFSDVQLHDVFRAMDKDADGHIGFAEYVTWHLDNLGAPRLLQAVRE